MAVAGDELHLVVVSQWQDNAVDRNCESNCKCYWSGLAGDDGRSCGSLSSSLARDGRGSPLTQALLGPHRCIFMQAGHRNGIELSSGNEAITTASVLKPVDTSLPEIGQRTLITGTWGHS